MYWKFVRMQNLLIGNYQFKILELQPSVNLENAKFKTTSTDYYNLVCNCLPKSKFRVVVWGEHPFPFHHLTAIKSPNLAL